MMRWWVCLESNQSLLGMNWIHGGACPFNSDGGPLYMGLSTSLNAACLLNNSISLLYYTWPSVNNYTSWCNRLALFYNFTYKILKLRVFAVPTVITEEICRGNVYSFL